LGSVRKRQIITQLWATYWQTNEVW